METSSQGANPRVRTRPPKPVRKRTIVIERQAISAVARVQTALSSVLRIADPDGRTIMELERLDDNS